MSLVRKRIKSPDLVVKTFEVGRYSSTTVALMYIRGVADEKIVERLSHKLERIDVDGIVDSAYVLSFIQTKKIHSSFRRAQPRNPTLHPQNCSKDASP